MPTKTRSINKTSQVSPPNIPAPPIIVPYLYIIGNELNQ